MHLYVIFCDRKASSDINAHMYVIEITLLYYYFLLLFYV